MRPGSPWPTKPLNEIVRLGSGGTPRARDPRFYGGSIPWAVIGDLPDGPIESTATCITAAGLAESSAKLVPPDAVLIAMYGSIGKLAITRREMTTNQAIAFAIPNPDLLETKFLFYFLLSQRPALVRAGKGATQQNISQTLLRDWPVPLPTLSEQRSIVEVLEAHLSRLDAAERIVSSADHRLGAWQKSSLDRIVRADTSSTGRLRDLVDRIEAGKSFGGSAPPARDGQWGVIKVSAMTWGRFRAEENKAVSGSRVDPRFEIRPGDILVSRANTTEYVGAPVLVEATPPRLLLSDKSLRLVPRPGVNPRWLVQVLAAPTTRRQISLRATGTKDSMRNISQSALLDVTVPVVMSEQQDRVITLGDAVDTGVVNTRSALSSVQARSSRLRRALLEAAFTGRLTGQATQGGIVQELADV